MWDHAGRVCVFLKSVAGPKQFPKTILIAACFRFVIMAQFFVIGQSDDEAATENKDEQEDTPAAEGQTRLMARGGGRGTGAMAAGGGRAVGRQTGPTTARP